MLSTTILERINTLAEGQLEARQVYKLLQWVIQGNKEMVEKMLRLGVPGLINQAEPKEGVSALHRVSEANDLDMARFLLSQDAHPDIQDKKGRTAIMLAAERGHVDMVELLASYQASGTLVDAEGKGLLFYCISPNKPLLLEMALDLGADVNNLSYAGESVFMFACKQAKECESICMWLLEKGANPNVADPVTGSTPLMEAVKARSDVLVRAILQRGGSPDASDRNKVNAAHIAASKGLVEVLRMLSGYSADFSLKSVRGDTALHVAAAEDKAVCCRFLFQRGCCIMRNRQGLIPSQVAKINGHKAALKELVRANKALKPGESPSFREARLHDWSLEHKAVLMQAFRTAEGTDSAVEVVSKETFASILEAHHAPIDSNTLKNVVNTLGGSTDQINLEEFFMGSKFLPKSYELSSYKSKARTDRTDKKKAEKDGSPLRIYDVPPDVTEKFDDVPQGAERPIGQDPPSFFDEPKEVYVNINQRVRKDNYESLKLAFSQCVPVDVRDRYYKTPLMTACIRGNYHMARFLISQRANVNAFDQMKWTSLHHACFEGHAEIVKLLLENNAVVDAKTSNGVTPLMRAIQSSRSECVNLLLKAGANIEATNTRGQSCVLLSQMYGDKQICEMIKSELESNAKLKRTPKGQKDAKQKQTPKKKETPRVKGKTSPGNPAAKKDAASEQTTTSQRGIDTAVNPFAKDYCITLPSLTIWGDRVPSYPRLQNRKTARLDCYEYRDKTTITLIAKAP